MKHGSKRQLHHGHFAFMRAVVQGIDAQASWDRYLREEGEHGDARNVRRTIQWIRDSFASAARQAKRPGLARLILLRPELVSEQPDLPSLEEFAASHGLEDFSHDEQIEAYKSAIASTPIPGRVGRRTGRRQRLITKQLEALRWLEQHVAKAPRQSDLISLWLDQSIARRLARKGLRDVNQLIAHVNALGERWWLRIPGIGPRKATRVLEWLKSHAPAIGADVGAHVTTPRRQVSIHLLDAVVRPGTSILPYEKFQVPSDLAGGPRTTEGKCSLQACNDREAIDLWLNGSPQSKDAPRSAATLRSYRKEVERLLLWSVLVRRKALSSLDEDDVLAYQQFLAAPPGEWCGPRHVQRWSPLWRPLEGPLAQTVIGQALRVLHGLYATWVRHAYLENNPFAGLVTASFARKKVTRTGISPSDWAQLETLFDAESHTAAGRRIARAMRWLRISGLGLADLTRVKCEHLRRNPDPCSDETWLLAVGEDRVGTRGRPVAAVLVEEFQSELGRHARPGDVTDTANCGIHILARFGSNTSMPPPWSTSGLAKAIRAVFDRAATSASDHAAQRWAQASVRSLRESGRR